MLKIILFVPLLFYVNSYSQIILPEIEFDSIEYKKDGNVLFQKNYYHKNKVVLEVNYRHKNKTRHLCGQKFYKLDSILIYHDSKITEFQFVAANKVVSKRTWDLDHAQFSYETYFPNGKLNKRSYYSLISSFISSKNYTIDYCETSKKQKGEYFVYDESGNEIAYNNYDTGEGRFNKTTKKFPPNEIMLQLKNKADKIVQKCYGSRFYKKYLKLNYSNTNVYHDGARSYHKNNGMPSRSGFYNWFSYKEQKINYIDFTYDLKYNNNVYFNNLITIRLDSLGSIIDAIDYSKVIDHNFTEGLLEKDCSIDSINIQELFSVLESKGFKLNNKECDIKIIWKPSKENGMKGYLYYRVIYDQRHTKTSNSNILHYKELLVNMCNFEITDNGDKKSSETDLF